MDKIYEEELEEISGGAYSGPVFNYTIQKGDCLSMIAQKYGTTVEILKEINNIDNVNLIYTNSILRIPYKG